MNTILVTALGAFLVGVLVCCALAWHWDMQANKRKQQQAAIDCARAVPENLRTAALASMLHSELISLEQMISVMTESEWEENRRTKWSG